MRRFVLHPHHGSSPLRSPSTRTSSVSRTPSFVATSSRTRSISRSMSAAVAVPSFTMKFACFVDTHRAADPRALQPRLLDQPARVIAGRIAEHRAAARLAERLGCVAPGEHRLQRRHRARACPRRSAASRPGTTRRPRPRTRAVGDRELARAAACGRCRRRSIVSTLSTRSHVSPPNAPAFIASAPPTVPGMPAKNVAGPSCQRTHWRASSAHGRPAPDAHA